MSTGSTGSRADEAGPTSPHAADPHATPPGTSGPRAADPAEMTTPGEIWDAVVGQREAVARLRAGADRGAAQAYLFVGPPGSTKDEAARAFAARLVSGGEDPRQRDARLALRGEHPDVTEVERVGASIDKEQAREIAKAASLAPVESAHKILILHEFHLVTPDAAGLLLKPVEEPTASTTFLILADDVPDELVTIASRCVRIEFRPVPTDVIAAQLLTDGVGPAEARHAARAANGNLSRARLLATDPELVDRRRAFAELPFRLDGTGRAAVTAAEALLDMIERSAEPLLARHAEENAELDAYIAEMGERGSGKKRLEDRHKRELRRHRTEELRSGLAVLAATYRDAAVEGTTARPEETATAVAAVHRIHAAIEVLVTNPNERLLLESLAWSLPLPRSDA